MGCAVRHSRCHDSRERERGGFGTNKARGKSDGQVGARPVCECVVWYDPLALRLQAQGRCDLCLLGEARRTASTRASQGSRWSTWYDLLPHASFLVSCAFQWQVGPVPNAREALASCLMPRSLYRECSCAKWVLYRAPGPEPNAREILACCLMPHFLCVPCQVGPVPNGTDTEKVIDTSGGQMDIV